MMTFFVTFACKCSFLVIIIIIIIIVVVVITSLAKEVYLLGKGGYVFGSVG